MIVPQLVSQDEIVEVERNVTALELEVRSLVIVTAEDHESACSLEKRIGAAIKRAEAITEESITTATASLAAARKVRSDLCGPLTTCKPILRQKIGEWKIAERMRIEEEARKARDLARKLEEDERLARAARLEAQGKPEAAERALAQVAPVSVVIPQSKPLSHGVNVRTVWSAEVDDLVELILWVAQDPQSRKAFLEPSMPALNAQARSLKEDLRIPGVRAASRFA